MGFFNKNDFPDPPNMLQKYRVTYLGGSPYNPKKVLNVIFYILEDGFLLRNKMNVKKYPFESLKTLDIKYDHVVSFEIKESIELDVTVLRNMHIIHLKYYDENNVLQTIFFELMIIKKTTLMECNKMIALLESNNIFSKFKRAEQNTNNDDEEIIGQIEKLAELNKSGILTNEEFQNKKSELLKRI